MKMQRVDLETIRLGVYRVLCADMLEHDLSFDSEQAQLHLEQTGRGLSRSLVFRMQVNLASKLEATAVRASRTRNVQTHERIPLTWWDHFKLRWFPAWAERRWPCEFRTIETWVEETVEIAELYRVCPHLRAGHRHLQFMIPAEGEQTGPEAVQEAWTKKHPHCPCNVKCQRCRQCVYCREEGCHCPLGGYHLDPPVTAGEFNPWRGNPRERP